MSEALVHVVPYIVLVINTVLFAIVRKVALTVTPSFLHSLVGEVIATIELCADCAELGN